MSNPSSPRCRYQSATCGWTIWVRISTSPSAVHDDDHLLHRLPSLNPCAIKEGTVVIGGRTSVTNHRSGGVGQAHPAERNERKQVSRKSSGSPFIVPSHWTSRRSRRSPTHLTRNVRRRDLTNADVNGTRPNVATKRSQHRLFHLSKGFKRCPRRWALSQVRMLDDRRDRSDHGLPQEVRWALSAIRALLDGARSSQCLSVVNLRGACLPSNFTPGSSTVNVHRVGIGIGRQTPGA